MKCLVTLEKLQKLFKAETMRFRETDDVLHTDGCISYFSSEYVL